jgi:cation diffusion facilitator family transporter
LRAVKPERPSLTRFAWLSIAAAIATIALKAIAYWLTGSVGLLSDALESVVNLVAAGVTLAMLSIAARPPDDDHAYGHTKAEYFASGAEGALILFAAAGIVWTAAGRLLSPRPVEQLGPGLLVSTAASAINWATARVLLQAARKHRSIALEADARHLLTDVWTSAGVLAALLLVWLTGWQRLDPLIALAVGAHIVWTGVRLVHRSALGLLDTALPAEELAALRDALSRNESEEVRFHALRTRQAGSRRFVTVHVLVPGAWTVARGHALLEQIERDLCRAVPGAIVFTHLEPIEDPTAYEDELDR